MKSQKSRWAVPAALFVALWLIMAGLASDSAEAQQTNLPAEVLHYADTALYNGKILTADDKFTVAEALAIRDGKILAVGKADRILAMAGPQTKKIDLKGKTVTPGIIDLHQHPFTEGMLSHWANKWTPNESEWTNPQEALDGIKRAVARAKPGEVVLISRIYIGPATNQTGGRVGEAICDFMTPEQKYSSLLACAARQNGNLCDVLTRAQIDSVSPNNPVIFIEIVNLGPHAMNTAAAEAVKPYLKGEDPFVKEGDACVQGGSGSTGSFRAEGGKVNPAKIVKNYLIFWSEPFEDSLEAYRLATRGVSSAGITLTKEHTAMQIMGGIRELWARGELTVRMRMPYPITPLTSDGNEVSVAPQDAEMLFRSIGNMSGIGDDMLRFVGIRPNAVGGNLYMGLAWTLEPKKRAYKGPDIRGDVSMYGGPGNGPTGEMQGGTEIFNGREAIVQAVRFGWDVSADHSVGDRAVREILNAYEEGLKTQVVKRPNQRLTLNHTPMAAQSDIERMKKMGVYASIGPWHVYLPDMLESGLTAYGTERVNSMLPIKSYLKLGMKPSLEGDVSVAPFWRMEKAISRKDDKYHKTWNPTEAISRQEALWMSTNYPAYAIGEQDRLGTLEVGKYADLIILDQDYMTVPEDQIHTIRPLTTFLAGKIVYEREGVPK